MDDIPPELAKALDEQYKFHGFDPKSKPTDLELSLWAMVLVNKWFTSPKINMDLPLAGLCIAYNMTTFNKLTELDLVNLKTMLVSVYNMGYNMEKYRMKTPFDKIPSPHELN